MEKKDIREIKQNPENPRTISEFMEGKLIESILVFPKMLEFRPILLNENNVALGGNQRILCLNKILVAEMSELEDYMFNQKKYRMAADEDKSALLEFWRKWKDCPTVPVRVVRDVTEDEQKELLVKDNLHYGEDDIDIMKKNFDREYVVDFFGSVPWNYYDYSDSINEDGYYVSKNNPEKFKCGYVECQLTDEEFKDLCGCLEEYMATHENKSSGFVSFLINLEA